MSDGNNQPTGKDFGASCLIVLIVVGGIAAGFGFFVLSIFGSSSGDNISEPTEKTAYSMACHWAGEKLKSPDSADFPFSESEKHTVQVSENIFKISSYVDAENSFGAEMRSHFVAEVKYEGDDQWRLISLNFN